MKLSEEQLQELADGITVTLSESECVRFLVEPDYDTTINDWDCYGRIEWARNSVYSGQSVRPDTFTGRAVKIMTDWRSTLWWEPPCFSKGDARQWHTDAQYRRDMLRQVRDIVEYGFSVFRVEYWRGKDAWVWVADYTTLSGIEPNTRPETVVEYLRDMVAELADTDGRYTVWVGGVEVTDTVMTEKDAREIAARYVSEGYDDVTVERVGSEVSA